MSERDFDEIGRGGFLIPPAAVERIAAMPKAQIDAAFLLDHDPQVEEIVREQVEHDIALAWPPPPARKPKNSVRRRRAKAEAAKRLDELRVNAEIARLEQSSVRSRALFAARERAFGEAASFVRAMKSPPAPSSASVTPKNEGGAG